MRARSLLFWALVLLPSVAGATTPVVISNGPSQVAVTIYRDPDREDAPIETDELTSFALITETREVDLPPGLVTIRFEGVAGGIVTVTQRFCRKVALSMPLQAKQSSFDAQILQRAT
jgi:hypothetical protein